MGGTVAALALCWWLQRHRFFAIAVMFVLAVPAVASIGYAGLTSDAALLAATFLGGFLVLGVQAGLNVAGALIYPRVAARHRLWFGSSASDGSARSSARLPRRLVVGLGG